MDIWIIPLSVDLPEMLPLSDAEWGRAQRLLPVPRRAYLASHYATRRILSSYLDIKPEQIGFQVDSYGKPSIAGTTELRFNLTHSEAVALCAVTRGGDIGVDVEFMRPIAEMETILSSYFAPTEYRQFSLLPSHEKEEAFFALWTRKEAFVKAVGKGLHYPLNSFRVPLERATINQRLPVVDEESGKTLAWSLFAFSPMPKYIAAVVVEGEGDLLPTLHHFIV